MNLLHDPLFRVRTEAGMMKVSLPLLLELLGKNAVHQYIGVQRHQVDAFHVFLSYLGGAVLARKGDTETEQSAEYWHSGLLELAGSAGASAWDLISSRLDGVAFMQPPIPPKSKSSASAETPDKLDLLQTAKNHDVKQNRAARPYLDEWIYALISLQTMSGFMGKGNQGISRMNSGFGNRLIVELIRDRSPGKRWSDAVHRLLVHRQEVLEQPFGYSDNGLVLVWTQPWDGTQQVELSRLDPFYIEICRRVKLTDDKDGIRAHFYSSEKPRLAAKELNGVVGDPWLPIEMAGKGDPKALTVSPRGLTAELMRRIMFRENLGLSALQSPNHDWVGPFWLAASVLVRGQGITDGFYEWEIMIPKERVKLLFGQIPQRDSLADLSKLAIAHAGTMQGRVLKQAVFALLQGGPDQIKFDHDVSDKWWTRYSRMFEQYWSEAYFPWLLSIDEGFKPDVEERRWIEILTNCAQRVLDEAEKSVPAHSGRKYRTITAMRNRFWAAYYGKDNFAFIRRESDGTTSGV